MSDTFVIVLVVLARLALPLLIPWIPLIILAALVLDAVDNSLLALHRPTGPGGGARARGVERAGREVDPPDAARGHRGRDPALGAPDRARHRGNLSVATSLFFAYLTTLIVVLYDAYRPIRAARDSALSASSGTSSSARRRGTSGSPPGSG